MKIRQGRKNKHNLYLQLGDEPDSERDVCLGLIMYPGAAELITQRLSQDDARKINTDWIGAY
jgi:hypothetical protein